MREFSFEHIPKPQLEFDWAELSRSESIDLEIGAGQGLHAIQYSLTHPGRVLLAVEKTHSRFASLACRRQGHPEIKNLVILHADAVAFVSHLIPDSVLSRVFLLYPNPYPKAKQANLRWHNRPFTALLLKKMKPGAQLTLATNIASYANEAASSMVRNWQLDLISHEPVDRQMPPRTHFEKKYLMRDEKCWNLEFRKPF